jgi:MFS family permease
MSSQLGRWLYRLVKVRFFSSFSAQAVGIWAGVFALGVGIGPILGGYLLDYFWWGSLFLICIPVVVITFSLAFFFIRESKSEDIPKPDIPGMLLSTIGLFLLTYGIIEAGEKGWGDTAVLAYIGGGILISILFAVVEMRVAQPMLPMRFFKNMSFTIASLAMILTMFALAGSLFFLSQYFQSVQGCSPIAAAIRLLPFALVLTIAAILSAKIAVKIGAKPVIVIGIIFIGVALFWLSRISEVDSSYGSLIGAIVLVAVGVGISSPPATDYIVGALPVTRAGMSSAVNQSTRQLGQLLGVAVLGSVMNSIYRENIGEIPVLSSLPKQASDAIRSGIQSAQITISKLFDLGMLHSDDVNIINDGAKNAFVSGMNDAMLIGAFVVWGTALFALIFLPRHIQRHD